MSGPVFLVTPLPASSSPVLSSDFDCICSGVLQEINSAASPHEACPSDFIPKQHVLHISEPVFLDTRNNDAFVHDAPVRSLHCTLRDAQLKSLVMSGPYELKALHLQGQDLEQQVVFSMSFVQGEESNDKIPVALGLKAKNLYLSCVLKDDKPTLQLESVDPKNYPKKKMEKRFVFNKIEINNKLEFESAQFPNWYISTSQAENMPVFLGGTRGGQDITDFTMQFAS